jgi:hypothetical protein
MKKLAIGVLLALGIWLSSCGSNTVAPAPTTGAGGNWEAKLVGGIGEAALLDFVTNFSVGYGGGTLTINSFSFFNTNSCFSAISSDTGSAVLNTNASGQVTGTLNYTVTSSSGNTLTLTTAQTTLPNGIVLPSGEVYGTSSGTSGNTALQNGVVTGNWVLGTPGSTSACSGYGTFTMCQGAATCAPPP